MHPRTPRSVGVAVRLRYHRRRPRCNSRADCAAASTAKTPTRPRSFQRKRRRLTGPRRLNPPGRCHVLRDRPRRSRPLLDAERTPRPPRPPRPPRLEATSASPPSYRPIENLIATYAELVDNGDFVGLGTLLADAVFTGGGAPVSGHRPRRRHPKRRAWPLRAPAVPWRRTPLQGFSTVKAGLVIVLTVSWKNPVTSPPHRVGLFVEIPVLTNQSVLAQHRQHGVGQGTGSQYGSPAGRSVRWTQAAHPIVTTAPPGPRSRLAA
jgi:hypothetical protein